MIFDSAPAGFRDWVPKELQRVGCVELLNTVQKRVRPKLHAFGHIHEGTANTHHFLPLRNTHHFLPLLDMS